MENDQSLSDDLPTAEAASPDTAANEVPRLRISHLLLWTFCSAVYLTLLQDLGETNELPEKFHSIRDITNLISGLGTGANITGMILLVMTRFKNGQPLLKSPGHWLIAAHANLSLTWLPYFFYGISGM